MSGSNSESFRLEARSELARHRRSLIAVSMVLLLIHSGDVRLDTISIFGNHLSVGRTWVLMTAIWMSWAYFLLLFYQHQVDLSPMERFSRQSQSLASAVMQREAKSLAKARAAEHFGVSIKSPLLDVRAAKHSKLLPPPVPVPDDAIRSVPVAGTFWFSAHLISNPQKLPDTDMKPFSVVVSRWRRSRIHIAAWTKTAINKRGFTENALPYIIASCPLIYVVISGLSVLVRRGIP